MVESGETACFQVIHPLRQEATNNKAMRPDQYNGLLMYYDYCQAMVGFFL